MEIEEAQAILRFAAQRRFVDWLRPDGKTVEVHVYPSDLPAVQIRLMGNGTWEYAE